MFFPFSGEATDKFQDMKIAAFYSDSPFASWGQSRGFAAVLKRMGHDVTEIPVPQGYKSMRQITRSVVEKINRPIDDCELVLVSGPEHLQQWINQFYPQWGKLKAPRVGWYHESFEAREDYKIDFESFRAKYDFHVFPDADDAQKFKGEFLSLGVDREMFCVGIPSLERGMRTIQYADRDIDAAFIGLMYPKRQRFWNALVPRLGGLHIVVPSAVLVQDLDGMNVRKTAELLAEQYRRIKVFVAFPSLSNCLVAKPLEAGGCGCAVVAAQAHGLNNVVTYDEQRPETLVSAVRHLLEKPEAREQVARDFCEEVHREHRMELRFEKIFAMVGVETLNG